MYDRKIFLYFALAIVGFLLWTAWQKDYGPKPEIAKQTIATPVTATTPSMLPSGNVLQQTSGNRLIQVKTDTFQVVIDSVGGNILSLKLNKYPVSADSPHTPETLLTDDQASYYVAQTAVVGKQGPDSSKLTFTSPQTSYQLQPNQDALKVNLSWKNDKYQIDKTYLFKRGKYDVNVNYLFTNNTPTSWEGDLLAQISRRGVAEGSSFFGLHTYQGAAISSDQTPYEKISYSKMDKENLNRSIKGGWLAMQQQYFVSAWVPNRTDNLNYFSQVASIGPTDKPTDKIYTIGYKAPLIVMPGKSLGMAATLYSGPEITDSLKQVAPHLDLVIDYGWFSIFSVPIFKVMQAIYYFVHNWGLAIILVTVFIKLLFYKLSETSYRSMARMRNLQPKLLALKDKCGDDRQKLSQATMELYRKEKVNPLGGCLPMIVQIPVFIALYYVLIESVQLRQAPFIFWIHDLSIKDPYYVLPILMGLSWMLQQRLNPPPPDPVQAKLMMLFPVVFTVLFATFPAGLVLYWIVNNCLSILQQWYIMRKVNNDAKKPVTKKNNKIREKISSR